jgi:low affinity Fe/Cu permease
MRRGDSSASAREVTSADPPAPDDARAFGSRVLSAVDRWASRPQSGLIIAAAAAGWIVLSAVTGFPDALERIFQVLVAAVTLGMLFVIQHTQARQQAATQRKLDEILHALPEADDALVRLEHGSDAELRAAADSHREVREAARDQPPPPSQDYRPPSGQEGSP